jgi:PAS domain S-box-containing protein
VVTGFRLGDFLFVQDRTGGIFVQRASGFQTFQPGDAVVIEGVTSRGSFAPVITPSRILVAGKGSIATALLPQPVSVEGIVTHVSQGEGFYLQADKSAIYVRTAPNELVAAGNRLEVSGFPVYGSYSPVLRDAFWTKVGYGATPPPETITHAQAMSGSYDGLPVRITGRIGSSAQMGERRIVTLHTDGGAFSAVISDHRLSSGARETLQAGALLRLTGICQADRAPFSRLAGHFNVLLGSEKDLEVLTRPSWWTAKRAQRVAQVTGLVLLGALIWACLLSKRVRYQSLILDRSLRVEAALQQRYRELFENSTDVLFTLDLTGRFTSLNPSGEAILEFKLSKEKSVHLSDLMQPDRDCDVAGAMARLVGGERSVLLEAPVISRSGRELVLEMNCHLLYQNGTPHAIEAIARDVTERKRSEAALQKAMGAAQAASRAKSEFLANMSHEIRTPMNGVLGMIELALESELTADQRSCLETVKGSAEALLVIINDILDYSKIEAGKMEVATAPFSLRKITGESLALLALPAQQKGIELVCDLDPRLPDKWRGDAARLRQVLTNLLGNAVKFTDVGEVVLFVRLTEEGRLQFSIRDTGIGIDPALHTRIFESFSQADGSCSRRHGGTGLGLAISQRLVTLMGGAIALESEPGKGSTFSFSPSFEPCNDSDVGPVVPGLRGKRVLVIESNASCVQAVRRFFEFAGADCITTSDADHPAIERGDLQEFSLIVAGVKNDQEPLAGACRLARRDLPVLALVPVALAGRLPALYRSGLAAHVFKPVLEEELRHGIDKALRACGTSEKPPQAPNPALLALAAAASGDELNVLVAEDNAVNQIVARKMLEKRGHRVTVVESGKAAIEAIRQSGYDLVLMDVQMPEMDGFEATRQIRAFEASTGSLPVRIIATTAHAMQGDRERCLEAGMNDYLSKPIRQDELSSVLKAISARPVMCEDAPGGAPRTYQLA